MSLPHFLAIDDKSGHHRRDAHYQKQRHAFRNEEVGVNPRRRGGDGRRTLNHKVPAQGNAVAEQVQRHSRSQRLKPLLHRQREQNGPHQRYGRGRPQEQREDQHGYSKNPPRYVRILHHDGHGPHHDTVAAKIRQALGQRRNQRDGRDNFHEFLGRIQDRRKHGLNGSRQRAIGRKAD
ncbi:hypothetical protein SDC9_118969 [bioreactor metagenome]|uniref:Uncharacterized protein n=1 Tax=bioreactor metagenome TaxID=1076179 RepID=A0A645C2E7_9ZZZZ